VIIRFSSSISSGTEPLGDKQHGFTEDFPLPNQQCQSTKGNSKQWHQPGLMLSSPPLDSWGKGRRCLYAGCPTSAPYAYALRNNNYAMHAQARTHIHLVYYELLCSCSQCSTRWFVILCVRHCRGFVPFSFFRSVNLPHVVRVQAQKYIFVTDFALSHLILRTHSFTYYITKGSQSHTNDRSKLQDTLAL